MFLATTDVDVLRRESSTYVDGVYVEPEPDEFTLRNVTVQPLDDEDLVMLEQAMRKRATYKMYVAPTQPDLRTVEPDFLEEPEGEKFQPDLVRYDDRLFTVTAFKRYREGFFRHRKYALLAQETAEVPA